VEELPGSLTIESHALLHGRRAHPFYRRGLFAALCVLPVLALLDVFGQHATSTTVDGAGGTLQVEAAKNLRGGLLHQVRMTVTATRDLEHPQLVLSPGMFEQDSVNSIAPDPVAQSSSNGRVVLSYGPLHAGQKLTAWAYFQVNPVNVGTRSFDVALNDGPRPVALVKRKLTVFP
jgi:hypothetical protein